MKLLNSVVRTVMKADIVVNGVGKMAVLRCQSSRASPAGRHRQDEQGDRRRGETRRRHQSRAMARSI